MASLLVVVMLVMTMSTTLVNAAVPENDTAKIIIQNDTNSTSISMNGIAFALYQVFDLAIEDADDDSEESIQYTVNEDFEDFFNEVLEKSLADYVLEVGTTYTDEEAAIQAYNQAALDYVNACKVYDDEGSVLTNTMAELVEALRVYALKEKVTPTTTTGTTVTVKNGVEENSSEEVPYGYYLVIDADSTEEDAGFVPAGSLITVPGRDADSTMSADVTISMKGSVPTMDKEVWHNDIENEDSDVSPTYGTQGSWDDVSDYQIGDVIEYRITATIPSDLRGYSAKTYIYTISDMLSEGIEIVENSVKIYTSPTLASSSEVEGGYHSTTYGTQDDEPTFVIDFQMYEIYDDPALDGVEEFYIYYKAVVTEDAAIATDYETNTATLIYSNNPYDSDSYGKIEDTVYTYTFDLDILKTEGDGVTPLEGAKFALYEVTGEASNQTITQIYLALDTETDDWENSPQVYYTVNQAASSSSGIITTNKSGEFDIVGLDDQTTYMLKEIEAPDGYNEIDPITFVIEADYKTVSGIPVPSISSKGTDFSTDGSGLFGTIINTSNLLLPSTGGMGTTLFTIIGGSIMLGAAVLLVVKRKRH